MVDVLSALGPYPAIGVIAGGLIAQGTEIMSVVDGSIWGAAVGLSVMVAQWISRNDDNKRAAEAAATKARADQPFRFTGFKRRQD